MTRTFFRCFSLSNWVRRALTTWETRVNVEISTNLHSDDVYLPAAHQTVLFHSSHQLSQPSNSPPRLRSIPTEFPASAPSLTIFPTITPYALARPDSPIKTTTNPLSSSTISFTLANNF